MAAKMRHKAHKDEAFSAEQEETRVTPTVPNRIARRHPGVTLKRYFTRAGEHPFSQVEWEKRSAVISGENGQVVFEQHNVEIPKPWSQLATNVVASKYFRGPLNTPQRENSVRQLIGRVVDTITGWGKKDGYFACDEDAQTFAEELTHLLVSRWGSLSSTMLRYQNRGLSLRPTL